MEIIVTKRDDILDRLDRQYIGSVQTKQIHDPALKKRLKYNPLTNDSRRPIRVQKTTSPSHDANLQDNIVDIIDIDPKQRKAWIGSLEQNTQELSDFFVNEIGVVSMALEPAVSEAKQKLNILTDNSEVQVALSKFRDISSQLVLLKVIYKLSEILGIRDSVREQFITSWLEKQHHIPTIKKGSKSDVLGELIKEVQKGK